MLSQTLFSINDVSKVERGYKRFRLVAILVLVIGIPLEFLMGFLASLRSKIAFWPVIILGLGIIIWAFYAIFLKTLKSFKRDLSEQIKLVGELQVISKSQKEKQWLIGFNSTELEKISISQSVYDKISIGDTLQIEISKYTQQIFKLSKNGESIIQGD